MRKEGMLVVNPVATNSVNLCALAMSDTSDVDESSYFCITSTARLVYNSCAVKVSSVSVLSACMDTLTLASTVDGVAAVFQARPLAAARRAPLHPQARRS